MTNTTLTEESTSQFAHLRVGGLKLRIHYNDAGQGAETVVMGSLAFGAPDLSARMEWLHAL